MNAQVSLALLILGPVVGVLVAITMRRTRSWQLAIAAIVGVLISYLSLAAWSARITAEVLRTMPNGLAAIPSGVSWNNRLFGIGVLLALALLIAGVAVGVLHLLAGRSGRATT